MPKIRLHDIVCHLINEMNRVNRELPVEIFYGPQQCEIKIYYALTTNDFETCD